METQNATTHLSPPNVNNHATVRSSTPSRTGERKIAKVTCRTPNQPPKHSKIDIENGRRRWRHSRSNKEKKWKLQVPTKLCSPLLCRPFSRHVGPRPRASRSLRLVPVKSGETQKKERKPEDCPGDCETRLNVIHSSSCRNRRRSLHTPVQ
jgi:hypothetical protein